MAKNLQGAVKGVGKAAAGPAKSLAKKQRNSDGPLSGATGLAAGAGAAALAPFAIKGVSKLVKHAAVNGVGEAVSAPGKAVADAKSNLTDKVTSGVSNKVNEKIESAGGPSGILKDTVKGALGGGGDKKGGGGDASGTGKGRRMPVQQSVDIAAPIETVYNQWTQFEEWPNFMHRVKRVSHEDEGTVSLAVKIWGKTKEFTAEIETQRPEEIIKWKTTEGMTHTGVVTFHELGPHLTRVQLNFDVDPGGLVEKAARGMRHIKRAARGDLHRFKAFIEMEQEATGGWRGTIEDGEVVKKQESGASARGGGSRSARSRGSSASARSGTKGSRSRTRSSNGRSASSNGRSASNGSREPAASRGRARQR